MLNRGFTLLELLVVIAIIGTLVSVILPVLGTARDKAVDAKVRSELGGTRNKAAMFYDIGSTYLSMCATDVNIQEMFTSAKEGVASTPIIGGFGDGECLDSNSQWAIWVNFLHASTSAFCVDGTGVSKVIPAQDSTGVNLLACP